MSVCQPCDDECTYCKLRTIVHLGSRLGMFRDVEIVFKPHTHSSSKIQKAHVEQAMEWNGMERNGNGMDCDGTKLG